MFVQLGMVAQLVDMAKAAEYLGAALALTEEPGRRGVIAEMLGRVLSLGGRNNEAVQVLTGAVETLGEAHADLRQQLEAGFLWMGVSNPALWQLAVERVGQLRDTPASAGLGGRMLDCMIAFHETVAGASAEAVVGRAHRGLAGNVLVEQPTAARPSSPVAACS